jgi:hypothetical protein
MNRIISSVSLFVSTFACTVFTCWLISPPELAHGVEKGTIGVAPPVVVAMPAPVPEPSAPTVVEDAPEPVHRPTRPRRVAPTTPAPVREHRGFDPLEGL